MNKANSLSDVKANALSCVRQVGLRSLLLCCAFMGSSAVPALAAPPEGRDGPPRVLREAPPMRDTAPRSDRAQPRVDPTRTETRQMPQREIESRALENRLSEYRRSQQMQQEQNAHNETFRPRGSLTADEKRDLRRQINEAGQDIYTAPKRR